MADDVLSRALEALLSAGWRGVLAAVALALVAAFLGYAWAHRPTDLGPTTEQPPDPQRDPELPPAVLVDGEGNPITTDPDPGGRPEGG